MFKKGYLRNGFWKMVLSSFICISVLISSSSSYGNDIINQYIKNAKLSNWLDSQGFKFGISKEVAMESYDFQLVEASYHAYENNNLIESRSRKIIGKGFYRADFANYGGSESKTLKSISKCIEMLDETLEDHLIAEAFTDEFDMPPSSVISINHKGRFLIVLPQVITIPHAGAFVDLTPGSAIVITAIDKTDSVLEEVNLQNRRNKALQKAISAF